MFYRPNVSLKFCNANCMSSSSGLRTCSGLPRRILTHSRTIVPRCSPVRTSPSSCDQIHSVQSSLSHLGSERSILCRTRPQYVFRSYCEDGRSLLPGSEDDMLVGRGTRCPLSIASDPVDPSTG